MIMMIMFSSGAYCILPINTYSSYEDSIKSSGIRCHIDWEVYTDILEDLAASFFRTLIIVKAASSIQYLKSTLNCILTMVLSSIY
jgi:hypothetical protein